MIVECPNCRAKYNLPEDKIPAGGTKVRCTQCSHVFPVSPGADDDDLGDLLGIDDDDDLGAPSPRGKGRRDDEFEFKTDDDETEFSLDIGKPEKKPRKGAGAAAKKRVLFMALALLVLVGGGAGLYYSGLLEPFFQVGEPGDQAAQESPVKFIVLENVRQYYVNNEKAGQLFVIEGKAVNQFERPRDFIKIEATLFDAKGQPLVTRQALCGNILSYFQLQVLSRTEIEAALDNEMGVLNNNTNLETGAGTPFMLIFFEPPEDVVEFGVKVIDAQRAGASR